MTTTHDAATTALKTVLEAALAGLDPVPAVLVRDPKLVDALADAAQLLSQVNLMPGPVQPGSMIVGTPTTWDVTARFFVGIDVVGPDEAAMQARASDIRNAIAQAVAGDPRLGGAVQYAAITGFDPEADHAEGMPVEFLDRLDVSVEFIALTSIG